MQKLLYEEFYNILNKAAASPSYVDNTGFKATPRDETPSGCGRKNIGTQRSSLN
ncbi:hypothetical protein TIFTF001_051159 [Ficus carica]|uniref:Uncharacterized protein n=1 Tax=Ficus carica TaxID=3494 RepID=A0AA88CL56_FICCA|nr:hypothetical protein TIFTF001_051159 [Ficus carica]